jgi:porphobilinogen deaminase
VGAYATVDDDGGITMDGVIATGDGRILLRHRDQGEDADALGQRVGRYLLDDAGASAMLVDLLGVN